jgi:DNA helicase-2/ATP-dependent DNA helicase PcrA
MPASAPTGITVALNEEQQQAVCHALGSPAVIVAGAGSGKTRVLTERVIWLITACDVPPHTIIALTFTNKAAEELKERVYKALSQDPSDKNFRGPRVGTIHSFALSAIRKDPAGFGLDKKLSTLDDYDAVDLLHKILEREKIEDIKPWNWLEKIGYHRARGIGFSPEYTEEVHANALKAHGGYHALTDAELRLWKLFEKEKTARSTVDFNDMLHLVVRRGRNDETWRRKLQAQWSNVLMDESQDTNVVQWEFFNLLFRPDNFNAFVVGDVSQSVYGFNGAAPELLLKFTKGWRGVSTSLYKLERNHRSVPEVVKLANAIQKKMTDTIPLQMISHRGEQGEKGSTKILRASSPREIAGSIAESIFHQNQLKRDRIAFGENAILVRSGTQIRDIETELVRWRVPYVIRGGRGLLQTEEAKDLLAYLRLATNPKDLIAFSRAISVPKRGFGDAAIEKVRKLAEPLGDDLIKGCIKYGHAKTSIWSQFMLDLQTMTGEPVKALAAVVRFTKYDDYVKERYGKDAEKVETKISNIQRLAEMIGGITEANPEATLEDVCFQLTLHASGENESEDGCAVITTIHAAKGLEWKRCFVTNCYEGSLPHQYARTPAEIEEERRLFYVAVTRAKDEAVLCIPSMIQYGPNTRSVDQSRFITEIMPK